MRTAPAPVGPGWRTRYPATSTRARRRRRSAPPPRRGPRRCRTRRWRDHGVALRPRRRCRAAHLGAMSGRATVIGRHAADWTRRRRCPGPTNGPRCCGRRPWLSYPPRRPARGSPSSRREGDDRAVPRCTRGRRPAWWSPRAALGGPSRRRHRARCPRTARRPGSRARALPSRRCSSRHAPGRPCRRRAPPTATGTVGCGRVRRPLRPRRCRRADPGGSLSANMRSPSVSCTSMPRRAPSATTSARVSLRLVWPGIWLSLEYSLYSQSPWTM